MKHLIKILVICGIPLLISFSCKEEANPNIPCGCDSETIENYENVGGTVMRFDTLYYIEIDLPDNQISIQPCEGLIKELRNEGLKVTLSGELKQSCPGNSDTFIFIPFPFIIENITTSKSE